MDHHAYLLLGERGLAEAHLTSLFAIHNIEILGNPDLSFIERDVFAVEDARELSEVAVEKAFGDRRIFVIYTEKLTPQAQNALLKTFEDPIPNTHFFISIREREMLLPTLLSRLKLVRLGGETEENLEAKKFLEKSLKQRLAFAKKFADEKEERGAGALAEFLDNLVLVLKREDATLSKLKKVVSVREYARDSAVMPRLILEHLALVI